MNKVLRFLVPILIAAILGPLIAGLALCAFVVLTSLFDHTASMIDALSMARFYVIFAYVIGGPIALLAGLLISIWMIWRSPNATVVVGAAVVATMVYLGVGALGILGPVQYTNAHSNFLFTMVFAVVAAMGCWLLTRRYARPA